MPRFNLSGPRQDLPTGEHDHFSAREAAAAQIREAFGEPPGETRHIAADGPAVATYRADWEYGATPDSGPVPAVSVCFSGKLAGPVLTTDALIALEEVFQRFASALTVGADIYQTTHEKGR